AAQKRLVGCKLPFIAPTVGPRKYFEVSRRENGCQRVRAECIAKCHTVWVGGVMHVGSRGGDCHGSAGSVVLIESRRALFPGGRDGAHVSHGPLETRALIRLVSFNSSTASHSADGQNHEYAQ